MPALGEERCSMSPPLNIALEREARAVDRATVSFGRITASIVRDGAGQPWRCHLLDGANAWLSVGRGTGRDEHAALAAALLDAGELADAIRTAIARANGVAL
jgi:hypothetical protein